MKQYASKPCYGYRVDPSIDPKMPFVFQTYREIAERADAFGSGLLKLAAGPDPLITASEQTKVGIYSPNKMGMALWFCFSCVCAFLF